MDVTDVLTRLGGVATRRELEQLVTRRQIRTAVGAEQILRAGRGRLALADTADAVLAAHRVNGVPSHLSAALQWDWKVQFPPDEPQVTVPRHRTPGERGRGSQLFWADLGPDDVDHGRTSRLRTVTDCGRRLSFEAALSVADSALREGRVTRRQLIVEAEGAPRIGRARAIRVARAADGRAANPFESVTRAHCLRVPGLWVTPQYRIDGIGCADLADPDLGLVIECESWEWHGNEVAFASDIRRYTDMVRAGWTVVRFTWFEVMFRPERVAAVLGDMVARGPDPRAARPCELPRAA